MDPGKRRHTDMEIIEGKGYWFNWNENDALAVSPVVWIGFHLIHSAESEIQSHGQNRALHHCHLIIPGQYDILFNLQEFDQSPVEWWCCI